MEELNQPAKPAPAEDKKAEDKKKKKKGKAAKGECCFFSIFHGLTGDMVYFNFGL